jgi:hypothetical protein
MRYLILILLFSSCISEKKLTTECADKFIIRDSVVYIERYDTLYEKGVHDTLVLWENKYYTDTINRIKSINKYIDKIIYRENTARVQSLNNLYSELDKKYKEELIEGNKMKEQIKFYKSIRNVIIGCSILFILFTIYIKTISKKWL